MSWQQCALFLAAGTSGVVASTLFGGDPADTAIAMTAGNAMLNIGSGFVQDGLQSSYDSVVAAITGRARTADGLPINHDLARAIRRSHLDAISYLIDGFETDGNNPYYSGSHRPGHSRFIKAARVWIKAEQKLTERRDFLAGGTHEVAINEVRAVIEKACSEAPETALGLIADEAKREAIKEFTAAMQDAGRTVPPEFDGYFDGASDLLPWSLAAQAFFAQRLKGDEKVRTVVFLERFNALGRGQAELLNALVALRSAGGDLADRMIAIEQKIDTILSRTPGAAITDQASLASDLATAVATGDLTTQIRDNKLVCLQFWDRTSCNPMRTRPAPWAEVIVGAIAVGVIASAASGSSSSTGSSSANSARTSSQDQYYYRNDPAPSSPAPRPDTSLGCVWGDRAYGTCH